MNPGRAASFRLRAGAAALAALLGCGCAGLHVGLSDKGVVVAAQGEAPIPGFRAEDVAEAQRRAVGDVLELFISSTTRAASAAALEANILSSPRAYIRKYEVLESSGPARVLALVATDRLLKDLDGLGLVRPEGVYGTPRILISLKETGPGAGRDMGRASDALRRQLSARGYEVRDFSDRLLPRSQKDGSLAEVLAAGKASGAGLVVAGTALAQPVLDERLLGLQTFRASVAVTAVSSAGAAPIADVNAQATAVDLATATAAGKALEDAGALAGEKLAAALSGRFRERSEIDLGLKGFQALDPLRRFMADLRAVPGVAGAAVAVMMSDEVKAKVFVEKLSLEDMAVVLLRLPGYSFDIRAVETDYRYIEAETTRGR